MLWTFGFLRALLVLSLGFAVAEMAVAEATTGPKLSGNGGMMATLEVPVWLNCQFAAQDLPEVPGFCARLRADFQRQTGLVLADDPEPAEGARVLVAHVALKAGHRATVTLAAGRKIAGRFVAQASQDMRLGATDAPLQAASAAALVYPLVALLETLR